jgi:heat shock protein HslJ
MTGKKKLYIVVLVLGIILVAVGLWFLFNPLTADNADSPACALWRAVSINGSDVIGGTYVTLYLHYDGSFQGYTGCNMFGGSYSLNAPNKIKLFDGEGGFIHQIGCAEDIIEQEKTYLDCLRNAVSYSMIGSYTELHDVSGQTLVLFKRSPAYPMDPADLIGTSWQLVRKNGVTVTKSQSAILIFDETGSSGRSSGKGYGGFYIHHEFSYEACGDIIMVTGGRSRRGDEIPPELIEDTAVYFRMPVGAFTYHLTQNSLELYVTPDLTYTFIPLESKNGG